MLLQILLYVWLITIAFTATVVVRFTRDARRSPAALTFLFLAAARVVLITTVLWQLRSR